MFFADPEAKMNLSTMPGATVEKVIQLVRGIGPVYAKEIADVQRTFGHMPVCLANIVLPPFNCTE